MTQRCVPIRTMIKRYILKQHGQTQLNIYQHNFALVNTLLSCSRHYINFFPHCSRGRRLITFAQILYVIIFLLFSRHRNCPTTKNRSTSHYSFVPLCIRYKFSSLHFSIPLPIQEVTTSLQNTEVNRTFLVSFADVLASDAFNANFLDHRRFHKIHFHVFCKQHNPRA